jgi:predicted nucleic acid-binding protein
MASFVDTDVWFYAYDNGADPKQPQAGELIATLSRPIISAV